VLFEEDQEQQLEEESQQFDEEEENVDEENFSDYEELGMRSPVKWL